MKNSKALFGEMVRSITLPEDPGEIDSIAYRLLDYLFEISMTEVTAGKTIPYSDRSAKAIHGMIDRINSYEPVQYVTGEEYFFGRKFHVNRSVLIPRPETEELIRIVLSYVRSISRENQRALKLLDIGTGSGCIPITLFHEITGAEVYGYEVSGDALEVAARNAETLRATVNWVKHDILNEAIGIRNLDVIVSNPPYVMAQEKRIMRPNVSHYEPHLALFVPDKDPLLFYESIVKKSKAVLQPNGLLAVEINEQFGKEVSSLFASEGFKGVEVIKDIAGKNRIVKGQNAA